MTSLKTTGGKKLIPKQMIKQKTFYSLKKIFFILCCAVLLTACESSVESKPETLVGFWKAEEISQHFWLDENIDSLSGFGQIAKLNSSGFIEWIQTDVNGTVDGSVVLLTIAYSNSSSIFTGQIMSADKFTGQWIAEGDTISLTFNKRTGN